MERNMECPLNCEGLAFTLSGCDGPDGQTTRDTIMVLVNQQSNYELPVRHDVDYESVLAAWAGKDIVGTQLGPNKNAHSWPPAGNGRACLRRA
jgi:hypothetical protein